MAHQHLVILTTPMRPMQPMGRTMVPHQDVDISNTYGTRIIQSSSLCLEYPGMTNPWQVQSRCLMLRHAMLCWRTATWSLRSLCGRDVSLTNKSPGFPHIPRWHRHDAQFYKHDVVLKDKYALQRCGKLCVDCQDWCKDIILHWRCGKCLRQEGIQRSVSKLSRTLPDWFSIEYTVGEPSAWNVYATVFLAGFAVQPSQ